MLLAVDVNCNHIYMAQGTCASGNVDIGLAAQIQLPPSAVEDGNIRNHAAFEMSLKRLLAGRGVKAKNAVFTFTSSSIISRRLELPPAKPRLLAKIVRNEMIQVVNDTGDYAYQYSHISDGADKAGTVGVWAYALPRNIIDEYYTLFKNLRLKPRALDIHANSMEKLLLGSLVNGRKVGEESMLFADIEEQGMEIHLFSGKIRAFSRFSPVTVSEFGLILGNAGFNTTEPDFWKKLDYSADSIRSDPVAGTAAHQYIGRVAEELQKMAQFQLRRDSANPVSAVFLYGPVALGTDFARSVGAALGIETQTVEEISRVHAPNLSIAEYLNAAGALIRFKY